MNASLLDGLDGWATQVAVWGYAVQGGLGDVAALTAEGHPEAHPTPVWDLTARDLVGDRVSYDGGPYRQVKDHAALPWVTEHALRGHVEWPRL